MDGATQGAPAYCKMGRRLYIKIQRVRNWTFSIFCVFSSGTIPTNAVVFMHCDVWGPLDVEGNAHADGTVRPLHIVFFAK